MKFKSNIEIQAGLEDASGSPGTVNQLLSSTVTGTAWIDPSTIVAEAATLVVIACKNTSGATIAQGTPVYQTGTVGATATIEIAPADALISANKLPAIGLLQTALNNNGFGFVVITGELTNFTTSPIDGVVPTTGDKVFVKSGGGLTLTKPTGEGNGIQNMGLVGKVSGGNSGSITVSSIMRTNDVPNLPEGRIWIGDGNTLVSDTVYVDEPNNRVGIGTTSPSAKLDVYGNLRVGTTGTFTISQSPFSTTAFYVGAGNGSTITFGAPASNTQDVSVQGDLYSYQGSIGTKLSGSFNNKITYNGDNYLNSGNLGIGTTSPNAKLDVVQATTANGDAALHLIGPNTNPGLTSSVLIIEQSDGKKLTMDGNDIDVSSGDLFINDYSLEDVTFGGQIKVKGLGSPVGDSYISNGNFGVGTTSPQEKLHVVEEAPGTTLIEVENTRNNSNAGIKLSSGQTNYNSAFTNANGDFQIYNSSTNRTEFHIGANGKVGVDTTSPSEKLQVSGNVKAEKYINQRVAWNSGFNHGSNNAASYYFIPVGYIAETTGDTYYNNWIAPYAGRVRKIVLRNTGQSTVPTATTVNFRVSVNGSVVHTGSTITVTGSGLNILASETLSDSTAVFSATDRVQVAYRTNGLWRNVAAGISLEYTE